MINQRFLEKLSESLYPCDEDEKLSFKSCLLKGECEKPAIIRLSREEAAGAGLFFPFAFDTAPQDKSAAHDKGEIYCLDASSVFAAAPLTAVSGPVTAMLDVCAAPGGKAIIAWRQFAPRILIANETIEKRLKILISNLKRCQISPAAVTCLDSAALAKLYRGAFDLVLVDAPCSGQSLLAKGEKAPGALNPAVINANSNRQKRILANAQCCVAPGGHLLYSTCTFSREENEKVIAWFLKKYPNFLALRVPVLDSFQSSYSDFESYRLFPQKGKGAGAFTAILKNTADGPQSSIDLESGRFAWKSFYSNESG